MSVFGKSQRYLAVLQKVSDIEMRLEAVKTEVDRQNLAHQAVGTSGPTPTDEEIVNEIESRFREVMRENIPTLVSQVRAVLEKDLDLEAVIGKEVFRLLENHLPELTANELSEEDVSSLTEEVSSRVRREVDGIVETKLNQLIPLMEKENASSVRDEFRPRLDHLSESLRRLWEEVTRLKAASRKMDKQVKALPETLKPDGGRAGAAMIPEQLMGRATIENLVEKRVRQEIDRTGTDREKRISLMENRLSRIARAFEANEKLLAPSPKRRTPKAAGRPKRTIRTEEEKEAVLDGILSTKLVVKDR